MAALASRRVEAKRANGIYSSPFVLKPTELIKTWVRKVKRKHLYARNYLTAQLKPCSTPGTQLSPGRFRKAAKNRPTALSMSSLVSCFRSFWDAAKQRESSSESELRGNHL